MPITSYAFLLLFLPVILLLYWLVFKMPRQKLYFLCLSSYLFYALAGVQFTLLLFALSLATFLFALWNKRVWPGIAINLAALTLFKYWDFGAANLDGLSAGLGIPIFIPLLKLALPLGISFYVFKHIGYLLDVNQQRYLPTRDFLLFTTYSAFFPQISAGPISGFQQTGKQLSSMPRTISSEQIHRGLLFISIGLAKKLLIADQLNNALQGQLFAPQVPSSGVLWAWYSVIIFALGLYFDFSGYTDIVLGVGHLLGVALPPNFNNPYLSTGPADFWQRWHISLSAWFRVYLFSPLSRTLLKRFGTKHSGSVQYSANIVTMSLVGLWHGAAWTYILWGVYHGVMLNIYAWAGRRTRISAKASVLSHTFFTLILLVGWALFLSPDLAFAQNLLANMFGLQGIGNGNNMRALLFGAPLLSTVFIAALLAFSGIAEAAYLSQVRRPAHMFALGIIVILCLLKMGTVRQFVYVQF